MGIFSWLREVFALQSGGRSLTGERFPELDQSTLIRKLQLIKEGKRRGEVDQPPSSQTDLDLIERKIVAAIETEQRRAHETYVSNNTAYRERLAALQKGTLRERIAAVGAKGVAALQSRGKAAGDQAWRATRNLDAASAEYKDFRDANRLFREPRVPESPLWHWAVLLLLVLVEALFNGVLLARGLEGGLVAGWLYAFVIATANVLWGVFAGRIAIPQVWHLNRYRKVIGVILIAIYATLAGTFNLLVAHYREKLQTIGDLDPAREAIESFRSGPLEIQSVHGWLLLFIGCAFSLVAVIDALKMDDPYPGFGQVYRARAQAERDYAAEKAVSIRELTEIHDRFLSDMELLYRSLENQHQHEAEIRSAAPRLREEYRDYLKYLERVANELLDTYRDANNRERKTPAPAYFGRAWTMPNAGSLLDMQPWPDNPSDTESDKAALSLALAEGRKSVDAAHHSQIAQFRQIADLAEERGANVVER